MSKSELETEMDYQLRAAGYGGFVREHRFHPQRRWRFDFAWLDRMIALEVDGGIWIQGRHNRPSSMEANMEKHNEASILGWKTLNVSGAMVGDGRALAFVERIMG